MSGTDRAGLTVPTTGLAARTVNQPINFARGVMTCKGAGLMGWNLWGKPNEIAVVHSTRWCPACEQSWSTIAGLNCPDCGQAGNDGGIPTGLTQSHVMTDWGHVIKYGPDQPDEGEQ